MTGPRQPQAPPPSQGWQPYPSQPPVPSGPPPQQPPNVVIIQEAPGGPGCAVRALWFLFIGWWLSAIVVALAYICCLTIIGLPVGFWLFNRLPVVLTLRPRTEERITEVRDGITYVRGGTTPQLPMLVRALWFILVGWWFGAIYLTVAWFLCVIIITLPVGLWLFNRVGAVMTLLRH
jgi:uncharacterized membrane protein YccF (DUF307 family)